MYNPPIETIIGEMQMRYEGEILRAVQNIGVTVDKDELIRALQYDRGQYDKGYEDGFKRGVEELAEGLKGVYLNDKWYDRPNPHTLLIKLFDNIDILMAQMTEQ